MKNIYRLSVFAVALIIAAAGFIPAVAVGGKAEQYEEGIIEYNLQKSGADSVQEWIDSELTLNAGTGSEWYIIALSNHGEYDFTAYREALGEYLSENETGSASSRLKYALAYVATDDRTNPYIGEILGNSIGEQGIMSLVFGLHLLNNGCTCDGYSANGLAEEILSLQLADGGFSVTGEYGDVDVTAMTVQALAPHYSNSSAVKSAVDGALGFLSARQLGNGGYSAYGIPNPESAAQVIIALSSLGIDVFEDVRFIKNGNNVFDGMGGFCLADGSFCHKEGGVSDSMATSQVLSASIAYINMINGKSPFYIFSEIRRETEEILTKESTTETATSTTALVESSSEIKEEKTSVTEITEIAGPHDDEPDGDVIIAVCVCIAAISVSAVLLMKRKKRFFAVLIVAAVAVTALIASVSADKSAETVGTVTVSINCNLIKDKSKSHIPQDGIVLEKTEVEIEDGDTVYDVLAETCRQKGIIFSSNMGYIEGINNIFEMDFGKASGWIYTVNGESPSVGCANYKLSDGDEIEWHYTCENGKDLDINFEK